MSEVTCVICHHKGTLIYQALYTLLQTHKLDFEIIVATTSLEGLKFNHPKVRVIHIGGGPAWKRNVAARYATGKYIAFYDDDIQADEDSLKELYEECQKPNVGMVFGKLRNMEHRNRFDEAGGFLTWTGFIWSRAENHVIDKGQFNKSEPIFAGKSAACMIKRNVFWRVGAFDPTFGILGEETDLAWRVWLSGWKVHWCPWSLTFHAFNTKFKPVDFYTHDRIYFNGCRNYITMLASNLEPINCLKILPVHITAWVVAGTGMLLTGKFKAGGNIFRGLWYCLTNLKVIKAKREKVATIRKVSDKELFKTIKRSPGWKYYIGRLTRYWTIGLHG